MMWNIVTDSSCDLFELENKSEWVTYSSVPFTIRVEEREYIDDEHINVFEMICAAEQSKTASRTACPSPDAWYQKMKQPGNVIAVTISSKLSGSYNSACVAKNMVLESEPDKKIEIIDSKSTGPEIILIIREICRLVQKENDFDYVVKKIDEYSKRTHIIFALCSFDNLVKNGRMHKITGMIAGKLKIWGLGIGSEEGKILMKSKVRGERKVIDSILADIKERGISGNDVVICHCYNKKLAEELSAAVKSIWASTDVTIFDTRGLCSYYAQTRGLIVAY